MMGFIGMRFMLMNHANSFPTTARSLQALEELKRRMSASPYADEVKESELRWFLLDRKLDVAEAVEKLITMLRWRREFG
jgi:hypothetical protein